MCKDSITIAPRTKINVKTKIYMDTKEQDKN